MSEQNPQRASPLDTLRAVLRFLYRYAGRYWVSYLFGFAALFATNWAVVRIPTLVGEILNTLERAGVAEAELSTAVSAEMAAAIEPVSALALELMLWASALIVVRTLSRVLFFNPGRDIQYRLGVDLFAHLLTLQRPFYARRRVGELVSVAANDTQSVRLLVGFAGLQVCNVAVAIPLHLYQMLRTDWVLTLWCVAPVVLGGIYMRWTVQRFYTLIRSSLEKLAALSDRVLESFSGVGTIRAHVAEEAAVERFERYNRDYLDLQLDIASLRAFAMPALAFSGYVGTGLVLWVGGNRVLAGQLEVGDLATFTALLISLVSILTSLAWVLTAFSRGTVALSRVQELLDADPELPEVEHREPLASPPRVELRELSFTHEGREEPALQGISVVVEPGHTLGIFGRTGSGKTTLIDLLARVYTPPRGAVLVDGHDVRGWELEGLREGVAVVPQSPFLFSTTLRDNIRLLGEGAYTAKADAEVAGPRLALFRHRRRDAGGAASAPGAASGPDPRLERVIDSACLGPDVSALPEGLDTIVGERGVMLSGGQRQRTALARALYREPNLLLLDDVLSAVDQATEAKLVDAIRSLRGRAGSGPGGAPTTVIVSHRTSVLEHADEILVLDQGEVIERGTHAELLAKGGAYAAAHAHQREEAKADG
ncbi:putative multidrug resistance ABC transporter ATP-binding/permease protein YheI [Enhygromyxa salina]|uniref:Putative multidrug resistance ABC transporter ATP-binding/permease protein YheI n=1 Tax=Enhygromyxa salina TaxID=215803 RepID=A0A2S9XK59_9BACT|nr:ABC transporter ATP-binding protein [Enhygromyxa salina]PRP93264.1 putative multidrug resistance ABC transporter ATP-binding/permease protein YheI [Enhygromyxa salina]